MKDMKFRQVFNKTKSINHWFDLCPFESYDDCYKDKFHKVLSPTTYSAE